MTTAELVMVVIAVFVAAFTQVLSGFGFALMSVPLMSLVVPTQEAVVISTLLGCAVSSGQAWKGRAIVERDIARRLIIGAYLGMPFGLLIFITVDEHVLKLMLGIAVLIAVVLLVVRIDLDRAGPGFEYGAGVVSGLLNTSLSTNGPPLAFTLQARHLPPAQFRATINMVFAFSNIVGISLFLASGKVTRDGLIGVAVALPALFVGQLCALPLRRFLDPARFRVLVLVLLVLAATSAIYAALK